MKISIIVLVWAIAFNKHANGQPLDFDQCLLIDPTFSSPQCAAFSQQANLLNPQQKLICAQDPNSPFCLTGRSGNFDAICDLNPLLPQCNNNLNAQQIAAIVSACTVNPNLAFCGPPTSQSALRCAAAPNALGCQVPVGAELEQILRNCQLNPASCRPGSISGASGNSQLGGAGNGQLGGAGLPQSPSEVRGSFASAAIDPNIRLNQNRLQRGGVGPINGGLGPNRGGSNRPRPPLTDDSLIPGQTCNCRSELDALDLRTCPFEGSPLVSRGCLCVCCTSRNRC